MHLDVAGYRLRLGETDQQDYEIEDRLYNQKDFDRNLVIDERTRRVTRAVMTLKAPHSVATLSTLRLLLSPY